MRRFRHPFLATVAGHVDRNWYKLRAPCPRRVRCGDYHAEVRAVSTTTATVAAGLTSGIATGVIEGACRYLVRDRMELTGARWRLVGADAVLKLRLALRGSGDFGTRTGRFHEAREYERNRAAQRWLDGIAPPVTASAAPMEPPHPAFDESSSSCHFRSQNPVDPLWTVCDEKEPHTGISKRTRTGQAEALTGASSFIAVVTVPYERVADSGASSRPAEAACAERCVALVIDT